MPAMLDRLAQHVPRQVNNGPGLLGRRHEFVRRQVTVFRVPPPDQRLGPAGPAIRQCDLGLKPGLDLRPAQCATQVIDEAQLTHVMVLTAALVDTDLLVTRLRLVARYRGLAQDVGCLAAVLGVRGDSDGRLQQDVDAAQRDARRQDALELLGALERVVDVAVRQDQHEFFGTRLSQDFSRVQVDAQQPGRMGYQFVGRTVTQRRRDRAHPRKPDR